jgi:hypothetical protein
MGHPIGAHLSVLNPYLMFNLLIFMTSVIWNIDD